MGVSIVDMVSTLRASELLAGVGEDALAVIAKFATPLSLGDGSSLMSDQTEVKHGHDLFLVTEGKYDVIAHHPTNPEELMTLGNLNSEVVGEIAWLFGSTRTATIRCRGSLQAVRIDGEQFMQYLESHPEIGFMVMRRLLKGLSVKLIDSNYYLF